MKVIIKPRGSGKSILLVKTASINQIPILCRTIAQKRIYEKRAKELGLPIPQVYTVNDLILNHTRGGTYKHILVNEADSVLAEFIRQTSYLELLMATMTIEEGLTNENS